MFKRGLLFVVLVAVPFAMGAARADTRTESAGYYGGSGDAIILPASATGLDQDMGGHQFFLDGNETSAQIAIADASGMPVGSYWTFRDAGGNDLTTGTFCDSSAALTVPAAATSLLVFVDEAEGPLDCSGSLGAGTTGTITVTYTFPSA
jgi:hypothetical protein